MAENPTTVGDLYRAGGITDADLRSAAIAYLADPLMKAHVFPSGYCLDIGAAVQSNEWALAQYRSPATNAVMKRVAVRTAIMMARPEKP
jgi:hypothetical protein